MKTLWIIVCVVVFVVLVGGCEEMGLTTDDSDTINIENSSAHVNITSGDNNYIENPVQE